MTKLVFYSMMFLPVLLFTNNKEMGNNKAIFVDTDKIIQQNVSYQLANENVLYQLKMKNGKQVTICMDKKEQYVVYRYGSKSKIELEYPAEKDASSFKKFEYSEYERGGGIQNAAMNLYYLAFTNKGIKYVVYDTYFSESNEANVGIMVLDESKNKDTKLKGVKKSAKGSLTKLRGKVKEGDELYD